MHPLAAGGAPRDRRQRYCSYDARKAENGHEAQSSQACDRSGRPVAGRLCGRPRGRDLRRGRIYGWIRLRGFVSGLRGSVFGLCGTGTLVPSAAAALHPARAGVRASGAVARLVAARLLAGVRAGVRPPSARTCGADARPPRARLSASGCGSFRSRPRARCGAAGASAWSGPSWRAPARRRSSRWASESSAGRIPAGGRARPGRRGASLRRPPGRAAGPARLRPESRCTSRFGRVARCPAAALGAAGPYDARRAPVQGLAARAALGRQDSWRRRGRTLRQRLRVERGRRRPQPCRGRIAG